MALLKSNIAKPCASRETTYAVLAVTSLVVFLASQLLFRYSTISITYPIIGELQLRDTFASIAMAFSVAAIAAKPHSLRLWQGILATIALIILVCSANLTNDYYLVHGYVLLIAIAGISFDRLCKAYYFTVMPIIVIVVLFSITGFEYNRDVIPNSRLVFSYGFGHPNQAGGMLFSAIGAMAFVCWNKSSWIIPFALSIAAAAFSYISLSSHASAVLLIIMALVIVVGHIPKLSCITNIPSRVYIVVLVTIPLCFLGAMLVCSVFYDADNPLFSWFNKLLHGRPYFSHEYYVNNSGFTLFGRKYASVSSYHNGLPFTSLDSGYSQLAMVFGLFAMLALIATYLISVWKTARHEKRFFIMAIFLLNSAYMLLESVPLLIVASFGSLFLSQTFTNGELGQESEGRAAREQCMKMPTTKRLEESIDVPYCINDVLALSAKGSDSSCLKRRSHNYG